MFDAFPLSFAAEASPSPPSSSPLSSNSYPGRLLPDPALSNTGDCVHVVKVLAASLAGRERVVQEIIHSVSQIRQNREQLNDRILTRYCTRVFEGLHQETNTRSTRSRGFGEH